MKKKTWRDDSVCIICGNHTAVACYLNFSQKINVSLIKVSDNHQSQSIHHQHTPREKNQTKRPTPHDCPQRVLLYPAFFNKLVPCNDAREIFPSLVLCYVILTRFVYGYRRFYFADACPVAHVQYAKFFRALMCWKKVWGDKLWMRTQASSYLFKFLNVSLFCWFWDFCVILCNI